METYRVIGVGADADVGDWAIPVLLQGRVFVGGATRVGGKVDCVGNAVDESHHGVLPVPKVITESQTEDT
jgi:hypothetical protein